MVKKHDKPWFGRFAAARLFDPLKVWGIGEKLSTQVEAQLKTHAR